jgi:hypothetical protein
MTLLLAIVGQQDDTWDQKEKGPAGYRRAFVVRVAAGRRAAPAFIAIRTCS